MDRPVEPSVLGELQEKFGEFRKAYDESGLTVEQFDSYGPTRRTLRQFCKATEDMAALIRDSLIPNPDA